MMKLTAKIEEELEINNQIIIEYAEMDNYENPEITEKSSDKVIQDYFFRNHNDIITYAKNSIIDYLIEKCDRISLHSDYDLIEINEIV